MHTIVYIPHPVLQPYVQVYMHSSVGGQREREQMELDLFPVGHGVLTFILDEEHFLYNSERNKYYNVRFNFTGQLDRHHHLTTSSASMIYAMFKPFGAFKILGIPQQLLLNECTLISDMLGSQINTLCRRMEDDADDPIYVLKLLEDWLIGQLKKNESLNTDRIAHACHQIMIHNGNLPIMDLYSLSNMSKSSLEHHFKEQVGLSPKMFSRVVRFNQVNKFLKDTATSDWQEIIYRYGYFDQSHFIHEFKHFFGYTPSQIHMSSENLSGHVSGLETGDSKQSY
ncbi:helix-turn-helix transcriptional regulator [Pedobacter frigoris]|uniref:Helix-turn-helix transcriptional regulator n=1 Tax=Pedobacter frigoris TaxID=2571272 RepID=A0A4U1CJ58_9SPHI|nr:AraC family transcriptional regulator [Pedobacter frigoris]TKC07453.1 helix-turn-helix transcriptional regulator [Pedobacter frigoris]